MEHLDKARDYARKIFDLLAPSNELPDERRRVLRHEALVLFERLDDFVTEMRGRKTPKNTITVGTPAQHGA